MMHNSTFILARIGRPGCLILAFCSCPVLVGIAGQCSGYRLALTHAGGKGAVFSKCIGNSNMQKLSVSITE